VLTKTQNPEASTVAAEYEATIRRELERVLASKTFRQVERLQRFLSYIVEETITGHGDQLKEYPVGVDVFGKPASFDPRMDPIVRVQARRLRMRLFDYYQSEGQADTLVIELPKGGYEPTFRKLEAVSSKRQLAAALISHNTVAVQTFEDLSADGDEGYFCRGLSSEIIHALSKIGSIVVVDHSLSTDAHDAAMIVGGTVRKAQDLLRITMHITDVLRGCILWSESVDRQRGDTFGSQEDVAKLVADTVRSELVGGVGVRSGMRRSLGNLAANNMYVQGLYQLNHRTEGGLRRAMEYFQKAVEEDPGFAQAYAGMADAQLLMANYGVSAPTEVWTKTASNASHAVLLDDESSEAHTSLAHVKAIQDWDWNASEQEFKRAIRLNRRNSLAHHWYGMSCLVPLGRLDEAMQELLTAQSLDPVSSIISRDLAQISHFQRNYEEALEQCDYTIEQNPHFSAAYWTLGLVQEQRGEFEEAIAAFQRAIELSPPAPRIVGSIARVYALAGRKEDSFELLNSLNELATKRYVSPFELALIYFALGQWDEGFDRLKKAFEDRCFELITIRMDPRFDEVRGDPRFIALFNQLGLP
jgi:tetratricopeptide (TPR) repeat protein/TolB-like protein